MSMEVSAARRTNGAVTADRQPCAINWTLRVKPRNAGYFYVSHHMPRDFLTILAIVAFALAVGVIDAAIRRRALRRDRNWQCARCATPLVPMQSELVPVSGGKIHTLARMCPACASRDRKIRRVTWGVLGLAFVFTAVMLWER